MGLLCSTAQQASVTTYVRRVRRRQAWGGRSGKGEASLDPLLSFFILNDVLAQGFGDCFGLGVNLQLLIDVFEVKGDSVRCDAHLVRRSLVVMAFDKKSQ